jgi:hypothetical protein
MSASEQREWAAELCKEFRQLQSAQLNFPPFQSGWTTPEKIAEWEKLCDAQEAVRTKMDAFIATR